MRPIGLAIAFAAALSAMPAPAPAAEKVDLELVLLADASRSIDDAEIAFERKGYAAAITHQTIVDAVRSGYYRKIAVAYVEWGDAESQDVVVPWTVIDDAKSAKAFADALMAAPRRANGPNAIGSAIAVAQKLIEDNAYEGNRRVIDVSGDSANSFGGIPLPVARDAAVAAGTIVNGLAIVCRETACSGPPVQYDLVTGFEDRIIGGTGSFVIVADNGTQFADAVRRKLLLEVAGLDLKAEGDYTTAERP